MSKRLQLNKEFLIDVLITVLGTSVFALALHVFTVPNNIVIGGLSGIATVLNYLLNIPVGFFTLVVNIPLVLFGYRYLGRHFVVLTFISSAWLSFAVDILFTKIPIYNGDQMLACIYGGVLMGVGLGLNYLRGGSSGGSDIINRVIQKKMPHVRLGVVSFITDLIVIVISTVAFGNIETALFAIIAIFVSTQIIDRILYGINKGKMLLIVTDYSEEVSNGISAYLERGCTLLDSKGAYSKKQRHVVLCAVSNNQIYKIKKIVSQYDPQAFVIIADASEVRGEGFSALNLE